MLIISENRTALKDQFITEVIMVARVVFFFLTFALIMLMVQTDIAVLLLILYSRYRMG